MSHENGKTGSRQKPSELQECYLDFRLSRQAMLCTKNTMDFYKKNLGKFIDWSEQNGITIPPEITARQVRQYLANYRERGCSDSYNHAIARSIRTFI